MLILAALENGQWWVAMAIVASSLLAVAYVWRFVEVAYFRAPIGGDTPHREAPRSMLWPAGLLIIATIYFGLETSVSLGSAANAAAMLLGAGK